MPLLPHIIFQHGHSPVVAAAIHDGHDTRRPVDRRIALSDEERLHEEDPFTGEWTHIAKTQIIGLRSRFEVDFNRPRDEAVYQRQDDAWGLNVWKSPPDQKFIDASLAEYDQFYESVEELLTQLVAEHRHVAVYDLHSYNHRRDGSSGIPANPIDNPEVNVGTGTMNRNYWSPVVIRFIEELRRYDFPGRSLDVRENVKFKGGYFGKWIHETFPTTVCSIAIEFKKFFMNEWTGEADLSEVEAIHDWPLRSTVPAVTEELKRL